MLTNLDSVLRQLRQENAVADDIDHRFIMEQIDFVSGRIQAETGRYLAPMIETVGYDICELRDNGDFDKETLYLRHPLMSVTTLTINGEAWDSSKYTLLPSNTPMKSIIRLNDDVYWGQYKRTNGQEVQIAGDWAWYKDRNAGWVDSLDALENPIDDSEIFLDVADADGLNAHFIAPRFSEGMVIRIDSEFMQIRNVDTATNAVGVIRGFNGSVKASHLSTAQIDFWLPEPMIAEGATRWAMLNYKRRAHAENLTIDGNAGLAIKNPKDAPDDFMATLKRLVKPIGKVRS